MTSTWSIRIIDGPGGTVVFWPWVPGASAGGPLLAQPSDLVTWNNTTANAVTLVAVPPATTFITNQIASGTVSAPIFSVPTNGIQYQTSDGKTQHSIQIGIQPPPPPLTS